MRWISRGYRRLMGDILRAYALLLLVYCGGGPWGGLLCGGVPRRSVVALWSLRGCSVVAPWLLRGRSVVAPWSLRGRPGPALWALRMRGSQRATGLHPVPLPVFATACTRHALPWPWPWALPCSGHCRGRCRKLYSCGCVR